MGDIRDIRNDVVREDFLKSKSAAPYTPTIKDQFQSKIKQHEEDQARLKKILALYEGNAEVREFAELLQIRLS